jgi:hypothetical protein
MKMKKESSQTSKLKLKIEALKPLKNLNQKGRILAKGEKVHSSFSFDSTWLLDLQLIKDEKNFSAICISV